MVKNILFINLFLFILLISCDHKTETSKRKLTKMDLKNVSQSNWDNLANKNIYFGHQSVGYNIIDGIKIQLNKNPEIKLSIVEADMNFKFNKQSLMHSTNGANKDPRSKIDAFYEVMENNLGSQADIAGFKFCYIDFNNESNVDGIFEYYKLKMNELIQKYPDIQIVHFTVPLRTIQKGPKAMIKKLIGKKTGLINNNNRMQFNKLLQEEFHNYPIFDLAKYESTYPDGNREFVLKDEKKVYALVPNYTYDGGHLNEQGKNYIAKHFLLFLAKLSNE